VLTFSVLLALSVLPTGTGAASLHRADSQNYSAVILADHPIMYWRLGEQSGLVASDSSGNGRDARYGRGTAHPKLGLPGAIVGDSDTAPGFDGVEDRVRWKPQGLSHIGPFTVEAWVLSYTPLNVPSTQEWFDTRHPFDGSFDIKLQRTREFGYGIRVDVGNGTMWFVTETIPFEWKPNVWYNVVAVASTSDVTIFVDGASIGTIGYGEIGTPLLFDDQHGVFISPTEAFHGRIDEVSVYDYSLTSDQVAAHYAAGIGA
jgi:Concanavalin A-like lectin/glucanases superfamily